MILDTAVNNCDTCKHWQQSPNPSLMWCLGFKEETITGPKWVCANWEKTK